MRALDYWTRNRGISKPSWQSFNNSISGETFWRRFFRICLLSRCISYRCSFQRSMPEQLYHTSILLWSRIFFLSLLNIWWPRPFLSFTKELYVQHGETKTSKSISEQQLEFKRGIFRRSKRTTKPPKRSILSPTVSYNYNNLV